MANVITSFLNSLVKILALIILINLFTTFVYAGSPKLYGDDGTYLGTVNNNPYDSESISNPYGKYGSPYSSESINNSYGKYGSPYSSESATNPYGTSSKSFGFSQGTSKQGESLNEYNLGGRYKRK